VTELPHSVLVVGLRRTGQAVARVLAARGVRVRAADALSAAALGPLALPADVELRLGEDRPELLAGIDLVVTSPGVPCEAPILATAIRRGVPVWSEISSRSRARTERAR
jgi:UDP-N-acetylmuramoylalanine--D-glutamate ligase